MEKLLKEKAIGSKKAPRNSNIEVLRVISMFLIILYHIIRRYGEYTGNFTTLPIHIYLTETALGIWGIYGVYLFVIISAWFQVDSKFKIKHIISILFETLCYVAFFYSTWAVIQHVHGFNATSVIKECVIYIHDNFVFKNGHWFIAPYIAMCFLSPFLNLILQKFDKGQMTVLLITLTGLFFYRQFSSAYFSQSGMFLYIYLLIGYIKRYCMNLKRRFFVRGGVLLPVVIFLFTILNDNAASSGLIGFINNYTSKFLANFASVSLITMGAALCLFLAVVQKKEKNNKFINMVGGATFGVYLFHETFLYFSANSISLSLIDIVHTKCQEIGLIDYSLMYPIQILLLALATLIVGVIVEIIRKKIIHQPFMKLIDKLKLNKIDKFFDITSQKT